MFKGVFTALVTPFTRDGALDEPALRRIVEDQIESGIAGLVPVGTTGESPTVTHAENIRVVEIVVEQANGRVPVIAGTGSNATAEAIDMTLRAKQIGATASLQVTPYYNKPNQEGLYRHFSSIAETADLPIIVYNIPGRSARNIENDTMLRLAAHPNIVAVKEASGDLAQVMDLIARKPDELAVLSGDDNLALAICCLGGDGVVSVASNLLPSEIVKMIDAILDGRLIEARAMHYRLLPLFKSVFLDTNPIPIKYAMYAASRLQEVYRLPLVPLDDEKKAIVDAVLRDLKITV
ncbi:MAG: 4-hydroxy-tetrahydrodipicolinate synthase [Spirochaetaceae bacterium]|nr:MAG: 4-hydroxy-tetrahydrodipicolinate synthase [Spirochaetaceae bacterium]